MKNIDVRVKNGQVFLDGELVKADILIKDGVIVGIHAADDDSNLPGRVEDIVALKTIDAEGKLVLPGTIDPHVHVRAPGYEEREDFLTCTMAAANGGVTTMIEQPLACPPQYNLEILDRRVKAADESAVVDFAFYGAAGSDFPEEIMNMAQSGKIVAFKTFLHEAPNGRDAEFIGLTMKDDVAQYQGMKYIGQSGKICGVHAENNAMVNAGIADMKAQGRITGKAHAHSRPPITEYETVAKLLLFGEETGAKIEFCHVSTPQAMELIKQAKAKGQVVYAETCPHYLLMNDDLLDQFGPYAKCNPPLREQALVDRMWQYVNDGSVDFIGSDHAPYTYEEKQKGVENIFSCPAGIPCIEMRIPLMLDAVHQGKLTLAKMVELVSTNPAKIFGLYPRKGAIQIGADADMILVDPKETYTVKTEDMYTKSRKSAMVFEGLELTGRVKATIVRGRVVMENGVVDEANKGYGQYILPRE